MQKHPIWWRLVWVIEDWWAQLRWRRCGAGDPPLHTAFLDDGIPQRYCVTYRKYVRRDECRKCRLP